MHWIQTAAMVGLAAVALKSMLGIRWPWEKCICCGKKVRDHGT